MVYTDGTHLVSTDIEQLHLFAEVLGVHRRYYEGVKKGHPHYDLMNQHLVDTAICLGAVRVDSKFVLSISKLAYDKTYVMATAKQHKAKTDIYEIGKREISDNAQGFTIDRSKPANPADRIIIQKGQMYWRWQHRNGPVEFSLEKPLRSEITTVQFLKKVYEQEERIERMVEKCTKPEDFIKVTCNIIRWLRFYDWEIEQEYKQLAPIMQQNGAGPFLLHRHELLMQMINWLERIDLFYIAPSGNIFDRKLHEEEWLRVKKFEISQIHYQGE